MPGLKLRNKKADQMLAFFTKVELAPNGCWEWTGYKTVKGYARFNTKEEVQAHRWSYMQFVGLIPEGLHIDHLCRNRGCVNPGHMEAVTLEENVRRGIPKNSKKTHCDEGHEFDITYRGTNGNLWRRCSTCTRRREAARKARLRGEAEA